MAVLNVVEFFMKLINDRPESQQCEYIWDIFALEDREKISTVIYNVCILFSVISKAKDWKISKVHGKLVAIIIVWMVKRTKRYAMK